MATNTRFHKFVDNMGPDSIFSSAFFTLPSGATQPTIVENQGFTSIARTGTGTYVLTLSRKAKNITVLMNPGGTPGAPSQSVVVLSRSLTAGTITLQVSTVSSGAAVDPAAAITIDILVLCRCAS
jgi:hypothetical protein